MDFTITLRGTAPLLMHNSRLANPLDPFAKALAEVTSKRGKADEDHAEIAKREWLGSLYWSAEEGAYLPGQNIERALLDAARMNRLGKSIERGVFISTEVNRLGHEGSEDLTVLVKDENFRHLASVKIGARRIMRCRPIFRTWTAQANGILDESQMDPQELIQTARRAGQLVGVGDWRPRYGRFEAEVTFA